MTYTKNREGYLIPSLSLPNQPNPYLNRYARLRLEYLEQNEPTLCDQLMLEGTLLTSCSRIGRTAQQMVDWADTMGIESVVIDKDTDLRQLKNELRWNSAIYR